MAAAIIRVLPYTSFTSKAVTPSKRPILGRGARSSWNAYSSTSGSGLRPPAVNPVRVQIRKCPRFELTLGLEKTESGFDGLRTVALHGFIKPAAEAMHEWPRAIGRAGLQASSKTPCIETEWFLRR